LARKREAGVTLPEGVEKTTVKKEERQGLHLLLLEPRARHEREGDRIKLPNAETEPVAFWREVKRRQTDTPIDYPPGSIGDLIARYRASDEFQRNAEGTQSNYEVTMRRFEDRD
jgi:hypothetical protein